MEEAEADLDTTTTEEERRTDFQKRKLDAEDVLTKNISGDSDGETWSISERGG